MTKRLQNRLAESRQLFAAALAYGLVVWLTSGIVQPYYPLESSGLTKFAWVQLFCFLLSAVMIEMLSTVYSLLRVYSRTVGCWFIMLTCATCFQFNSMSGAIVSLCTVVFFLMFYRTYQDDDAPGGTYYAFLCLGLATLVFVRIIIYVPVLWFFMGLQFNSLNLRTTTASLLGLLTPYWFITPYLLITDDLPWLMAHAEPLFSWQLPTQPQWTVNQVATLAWVTLVGLTGTIHFMRNSYADKVRTRIFYYVFISLMLLTLLLMVLMPTCYDELMCILIVCVAPLAAHFTTFTNTRVTNVVVIAAIVATVLLTLFNLWRPSLNF